MEVEVSHSNCDSFRDHRDYDAVKLRRDIETCKESIDLNRWDFSNPLRTEEEKRHIIENTKLMMKAKDELERLLGAKNA